MIKWPSGRWILWTGILTGVMHGILVWSCPYWIMLSAMTFIGKQIGINTLVHTPPPTAQAQPVIRSSPDLMYSTVVFDVSQHPLHITAPIPDCYMSLSMYAHNTDNFFVINDSQLSDPVLDVLLTGPASDFNPSGEFPLVVHSPSRRGILLFRFFAGDDSRLPAIEAMRQQIRVDPVGAL